MLKVSSLHPWLLAPRQARLLQTDLATSVRRTWDDRVVKTVAGCDVHFPARRIARAAVVVMSFSELEVLESLAQQAPCDFPYVPGLLSFREIPALLPLFRSVRDTPDLLLCDGQGVAHPRRLGLASHLGLVLQIPTIGCAKSRLVGEHDEVEPARGSTAVLRSNQGEPLGMVVRTRDTIKPVYVSVGHLVTLNKAVEFVLQCSPRYRIPEPLRRAHNLASQSGAQA